MAVWSAGISLQGKIGAMLRYGANPPTATDGNDGDSWIATNTGRLYAVKSGGQWPTTYATLAAAPGRDGAAGAQFTFGTATPGATYGAVGDVYLKTTDYTIYNKVSTGWQYLGSLKGAKGDVGDASTVAGPMGKAGSVIYTITGAPSTTNPSTQTDGDYAFQTDAANGPTFFGPRSGGVFPSSGTSLRGLVGAKGDRGDAGQVGPASPGLYSGSGAPSATNPSGAQVDGSYYIRNDVSPALLYGPRTSGVWPTTAQNTGGSQTQTCSGPPQATLGAVGDVAYDLTNALFYPPKTANGWTTAPINMVGPTGPVGPTTSYRQSVRGSVYISGAPAVGTNYPVLNVVAAASASTFGVPVVEPMYAAGSLTALTASSPAGVGAGVWSLTVLKNGTALYTASAFLSLGSTVGTAYKVLPTTGLTFAAGDIITMTGTTTTTNGNQSFNVGLIYTTNS